MLTNIFSFLAVLFWASAFVVTRYMVDGKIVTPIDLAILRYFLAAVLLSFLFFSRKISRPKLKDLPLFIISGILGFSGYGYLFNVANVYITPATASVINAICPGITAIWGYFLFKEKINNKGKLGLFISFIGVAVLSLWNGKLSINHGIFIMLLAAFFLGTYNILQRLLVKRYTALESIAYSIIFGVLSFLPFNGKSLELFITNRSLEFWGPIIYLAVFPSIVAYYCWTKAMSYCKTTTEVTKYMFVTPILTIILAIIFMGSMPTMGTYLGGAIILSGMYIFSRR